ncbi:SRPBCC domain-containing protein [Sphingobium sp. EM0848]|uniref:SRPBCC domain-containing protein n=1 Tax=Sphingobium sp. EM0848 TaxID=2743473 RepID=UPI00159C1D6B|nr:SRPBCC domain-containing protein [Sphingobium sp. EM0848]
MSDSQTHRASRTILASPRAIYRAFLDAEAVASWRPPSGMTARIERFVPKIGGGYRMAFVYSEGSAEGKSGDGEDVFEGEFVDLIPDQKIVETVTFQSDDPAFAGTMTVTTTIEREKGNSSKVTFLAENVPPGISETDHREGMSSSLRNLANLVE